MNDLDDNDLDPGIRDVVLWLRSQGWQTTDSGDGTSKGEDAVIHEPHVVIRLGGPSEIEGAVDSIWRALGGEAAWERGVTVEGSYGQPGGVAVVIVCGCDNEALRDLAPAPDCNPPPPWLS